MAGCGGTYDLNISIIPPYESFNSPIIWDHKENGWIYQFKETFYKAPLII